MIFSDHPLRKSSFRIYAVVKSNGKELVHRVTLLPDVASRLNREFAEKGSSRRLVLVEDLAHSVAIDLSFSWTP